MIDPMAEEAANMTPPPDPVAEAVAFVTRDSYDDDAPSPWWPLPEPEWIRVQLICQLPDGCLLIRAEDGTFGRIKAVKLEDL